MLKLSLVEQIKALLDNYPRFPNDVPLINPTITQYEDWIKQVKKDVLKLLKADQKKREALMAHLLPENRPFGEMPITDIWSNEKLARKLTEYVEYFEELDKLKLGKVDVVCIKLTDVEELQALMARHRNVQLHVIARNRRERGELAENQMLWNKLTDKLKELLGDAPKPQKEKLWSVDKTQISTIGNAKTAEKREGK